VIWAGAEVSGEVGVGSTGVAVGDVGETRTVVGGATTTDVDGGGR